MIALLSLLFACEEPTTGAPPPSRVAAVAARPVTATDVEAFCEQRHDSATAPPFAWPDPLQGDTPAAVSTARWVSLWATWCAPCIAEAPMIVQWQQKMAKEGVPFDLVMVSVDADSGSVVAFRKKNPEFPPGPRFADIETLSPWLEARGVAPSTAIPLHFLLDAEGRTRCVRAGAVSETDYAVVREILRDG